MRLLTDLLLESFTVVVSLAWCVKGLQRGLVHDAEVRRSRARSQSSTGRGRCCSTARQCQHTSSRLPFAGLYVIRRNKDDMGDGAFPRTNFRTTTFHRIDSHCRSHIVASCVFVLLVPTAMTRRRRVPSTMSTSPSSSTRPRHISKSYPPRASS